MKEVHRIARLADTLIRLAPDHLPFGRGLLRAVALEHPGATMGDARAALRLALDRLDVEAQRRLLH